MAAACWWFFFSKVIDLLDTVSLGICTFENTTVDETKN